MTWLRRRGRSSIRATPPKASSCAWCGAAATRAASPAHAASDGRASRRSSRSQCGARRAPTSRYVFTSLPMLPQLLSYVLTYLLVQSLLYSLSRSARARRSRTRTSATTRSGLPRLETASRAATLPRRATLHSSTQGPGRAAAPRMAPSSRSPPQTAEGRGPRRWGRPSPLW